MTNLWRESHGYLHVERLQREAAQCAARFQIPITAEEWHERRGHLVRELTQKIGNAPRNTDLDFQIHGEIPFANYTVRKVSFLSHPGIRVPGHLFVPHGSGPFPAVLNCHGHWQEGKIAPRVQARGHALAANGLVALSVDVAGAGERGINEREWMYHGAMEGAEFLQVGDSLLGLQVRDNRRALDVLESLPFVDRARLGVTGASGGGNQTMWLAALDERVKAAVPVCSVGSFEVYVGAKNCICEVLPGGLKLLEEWELLGMIAPRALLLLTALHDANPTFGWKAMEGSSRKTEEIYRLLGARSHFDRRILNMDHGFYTPALELMVGWMKHWLGVEAGALPIELPVWKPIPEENALCYAPGQRPEECGYKHAQKVLIENAPSPVEKDPNPKRRELAELVGWQKPTASSSRAHFTSQSGQDVILSPRNLTIPISFNHPLRPEEKVIRILLSPMGKQSAFVQERWESKDFSLSADLPAVGELSWETGESRRFHESARACLWLGYTLALEWAEVIAVLCMTLRDKAPEAEIQIFAQEEAALAALLALALHPTPRVHIDETDVPKSLREAKSPSMVWFIPGILSWGDLDALRALA